MGETDEDLCVLHTWQFDDECEWCAADVERFATKRKQRLNSSNKLIKEIAQLGGAVDPNMQLHIRMDMILQVLMNQKQRNNFESEFLGVWGNQLLAAKEQMVKSSLTQGIVGPNGMPFDPKRVG